MNSSSLWRFAKQFVRSLDATFSPLKIVWIVKLPCGCTMSELVNPQRTKTCVEFSRSLTCRKWRHFTGHESGWPQIVDANKATILHCDASCARSDPLFATEALQNARRSNGKA